ncbi:MAG: type II toxin-antitoxin system PemK/MazF family toxin [Leptospirales bacterium]
MAINFHPKPGMVLMCDLNTGFKPPEMVKKRPVVILTSRNPLCIIVPLSTTPPSPIEKYHLKLDPLSLPPILRNEEVWVKGDHIITVSFERLDRVRSGQDKNGKRQYVTHIVTQGDFKCIQSAIFYSLGLTT